MQRIVSHIKNNSGKQSVAKTIIIAFVFVAAALFVAWLIFSHGSDIGYWLENFFNRLFNGAPRDYGAHPTIGDPITEWAYPTD